MEQIYRKVRSRSCIANGSINGSVLGGSGRTTGPDHLTPLEMEHLERTPRVSTSESKTVLKHGIRAFVAIVLVVLDKVLDNVLDARLLALLQFGGKCRIRTDDAAKVL